MPDGMTGAPRWVWTCGETRGARTVGGCGWGWLGTDEQDRCPRCDAPGVQPFRHGRAAAALAKDARRRREAQG